MRKTTYDACGELAELIKSGFFYDKAGAIEHFIIYLEDEETPAMALGLVKQNYARGDLHD